MKRRLLDPAFLELGKDWLDLALEQHEVAHEHCLGVAHLLECHPGAEGQGGLDRYS